MRIFIALDIDDAIRQRIQRFMEGVSGFAPDARWRRPESLHVTLKFVGEKSEGDVEKITRALEAIAADAIEIKFCSYGFFPSVRAPRVFWGGIEEAGSKLTSLAKTVDQALTQL